MARLIASSTKFQKAPPLGQAIHCVMSLVVNLREQVLDHGTASCEKALEHYNDGKDNPLAEKCWLLLADKLTSQQEIYYYMAENDRGGDS
jgi:hypothetical protein